MFFLYNDTQNKAGAIPVLRIIPEMGNLLKGKKD